MTGVQTCALPIFYGPGCKLTLADLDNLLCDELGYEPSDEHWLFGWARENSIAGSIAFNCSPEELNSRIQESDHDGIKALWSYLKTHFIMENNWASDSRWQSKWQKVENAWETKAYNSFKPKKRK